MASNGTDSSVDIEYLLYVTSPDGEEYSYVLSLNASAGDDSVSAALSIRGSDGEISCTMDASAEEERGMCTGPDGTYEWTSEGANGWS